MGMLQLLSRIPRSLTAPRLCSSRRFPISPTLSPVRVNYTWVNKHVTTPPGQQFPPSWFHLPNGPEGGELPSGHEFMSQLRSLFKKGVKKVMYLKIPHDLKSDSSPPHYNSVVNVDSFMIDRVMLTFQVGTVARNMDDGRIIFAMLAVFDLHHILPLGIMTPSQLDMNITETAGLAFATVAAVDNQVLESYFITDSSYARGVLVLNSKNNFGHPSLFFFAMSLKLMWLSPPEGVRFISIAHVTGLKDNRVADALSRCGSKKGFNERRVFKEGRKDLASNGLVFVKLSSALPVVEGENYEALVRLLIRILSASK